MNSGTIGVIIVIVVILVFLYFRKRSDRRGKEEIDKFLDSLQEEFEYVIIDFIDKFDINNLDNLAVAEQEILDQLVAILWNKSVKALETEVKDPVTKALIKKFLTKEYIAEFTEKLFKEVKVQEVYTSKYNGAIVAANKESILLEANMTDFNKEIEDNDPIDFRKIEDIDPGSIIDSNGEIIKQELNPQHEDEIEDIDLENDAAEIVEE